MQLASRNYWIYLALPLAFWAMGDTTSWAQSGSRGGGGNAAAAYYAQQQQLAQQQALQRQQAEAARLAAAAAAKHAADVKKSEEEQRRGIAIVELFTSQGCSSCPPADKALKQIDQVAKKRGLKVFALSFHVDYWDRLGWKDPYSQKDFSTRQATYAAKKDTNQIYTPQMIVNGTKEFLGSDQNKAHDAIIGALRVRPKSTIGLQTKLADKTLDIDYEIEGVQTGYAMNFAVIHSPSTTEVTRGENAGKQLEHVNVVRAFKVILPEEKRGKTSLTLPEEIDPKQPLRLVAYLQNKDSYEIVGANITDLERKQDADNLSVQLTTP